MIKKRIVFLSEIDNGVYVENPAVQDIWENEKGEICVDVGLKEIL